MILYYLPGACSLATHIALIESGLAYTLNRVDQAKRTEDGRDFHTINPKGYVPALALDDGTVLTENLALLAWIAHQSGKLLAADGLDRWRALEAVAFMTTELHGNFKPLFYPDTPDAQKTKAKETLVKRFGTLAEQLGDRPYLIGDSFSIADAYLFVMLSWAKNFQLDVSAGFTPYFARLAGLPSITRALAEEGLS